MPAAKLAGRRGRQRPAESRGPACGGRATQGGNPDFFLDIAVPWADLIALGLDRDTPIRVWAGSSSSESNLDGDLACHDRVTGDGQLDGVASNPTTGDPALDPSGNSGLRLEGGGGCAAGGSLGLGVALALAWLHRKRRLRRPGSDPSS
jgi:hypothetical protein